MKPKRKVQEEAPLCADCKSVEERMGTSAAELGDFVRRIVNRELHRAAVVAKTERKESIEDGMRHSAKAEGHGIARYPDLQSPPRVAGAGTETGRRGSGRLHGNAPKDSGVTCLPGPEKAPLALRRPRGRGLP